MVDTVMRPDDWRTVYQEAGRHLNADADAVLAVTSYVDDESPLWVERDAHGMVRGFPTSGSAVHPPCVTGGVYAFGPRARLEIEAAVGAGVHRVRGFLARLLESGARIATVDVPRIVDVDRKQDLETANDWLVAIRT